MDYERAETYEMPETEPDSFAEAYLHTPVQKIRTYSLAQFDHWTKEQFSSNFRKMLTLEHTVIQNWHNFIMTILLVDLWSTWWQSSAS